MVESSQLTSPRAFGPRARILKNAENPYAFHNARSLMRVYERMS